MSDQAYQPLKVDFAVDWLRFGPRELWWRQIPFVGWWVNFNPEYRRVWHQRADVCKQLAIRTRFPAKAWETTGVRVEHAVAVARVVAHCKKLPNSYLLPDDPMSLLLLDWEGIGPMICHAALRTELSVDVKETSALTGTFLDLVRAVYR